VKVAAIQMTSGAEVQENLRQARTHLESAARQGAALAVLPENFAFMGLGDADKRAIAEADGDGPIQEFLGRTARELRMWVIGGTIPLRGEGDMVAAGRAAVSTASSAGRVAAASLVYTSDGVPAARYDKIHLFDVDIPGKAETYRESAHVAPGLRSAVVDTPVGSVGLSVCYDMRFPELFREMSKAGAELLSIPSAFTAPTGRAHWETLLRARAIENLCYVMAPAQSGFHANGRETYGDSMIVDYWGRVLRRLPRGQGCVVADVDLAAQAEVRKNFPALEHRVL
jgi:deaminated glutathione amidase